MPKPEVDLDFVIEYPVSDFDLPYGWKADKNRFANPKLVNGKNQIDYVPITNIYSIIKRKLAPTIENYLTGVPLKIQSIAYDIQQNKIVGEIGIETLKRRVVEVNNLLFAEYAAKKKGQSLKEMILEKAESLKFRPIFP